jgi:hypothetical protein
MNNLIGFSTGALARSDYARGLSLIRENKLRAVELSALREHELEPLINAIDELDLRDFEYISFHAPSKLELLSEHKVVELLLQISRRGWPIIVHPDIIRDIDAWSMLGKYLCIENMDKRKPVGRTLEELEVVFERLPQATFCLDLGHARQVDSTMGECLKLLRKLRSRLTQLHVSEVTSGSKHVALTFAAMQSFWSVQDFIPVSIPVILEPLIEEWEVDSQVKLAERLFEREPALVA